MPPDTKRSFQSRAREAMKVQFKAFYYSEWPRIREMDARRDMWILFNMFATWLEAKRNNCVPAQTEKNGNIAMSRALPSLGEFCAIHDEAAEELVWDTFHTQASFETPETVPPTTPSLTEPSPTARGGRGGEKDEEEASR